MISFPVSLLAAPDALLPTELDSYGDCVTPRITAPTHLLQSRLDRQYCTERNAGHPERIKTCLANTSLRTEVTFFWDSCGSQDGPFQISLGGVDRTLRKVKPWQPPAGSKVLERVPVAGFYESSDASGLLVTIEPGRLLKRTKASDGDIGEVESEVVVIVRQASSGRLLAHRIAGRYWQQLYP